MRRVRALVLAALCLALAGCSLARPEAEGNSGDRFVGFYVVKETNRSDFYDNPHLAEYGSETLDAGKYGSFDIPRMILKADPEDHYAFPGLEGGYSLFTVVRKEEDGNVCLEAVSNMGPGDGFKVESINTEQANTDISGVIYCGAPEGVTDWESYQHTVFWTAYRVYQTADGTVYINGDGNSYQGGGSMSFSTEESFTTTVNGESVTETTKVSVKFEEVPRLEKLVVTQFDEKNQVLDAQSLALREDLPAVEWAEGAAWALVEEVSAEGTVRTVYSVPAEDEDPVSHQVVLLDEEGMGTLAYVQIGQREGT